jgi:Protein of unknown function (DUF4238)
MIQSTSWTLHEAVRFDRDGITSRDWSGYPILGLMRVRVPATRDAVELIRAEEVKATARFLDRQGKLPPKPEGCEDILDHLSVPIDPHQSLHAMPHLAKGFGVVLDHLGFDVVHNESGISFITSDNPVVYFDPSVPEANVLPYQLRPPLDSIELFFPIDARTVLRGHTGLRRSATQSLRHVSLTGSQEIKRINRYVARFGYRFVFAPDRTHEALIVKHASTFPVIKTVAVPRPTGGTVLWNEWVFGARPTKPKWEDDVAETDE